jgi:alpha-beta hydrolase superfamily lysophospholipase
VPIRRLAVRAGAALLGAIAFAAACSLATAAVATYLYPNVIYALWRGPERPAAAGWAGFRHVAFRSARGDRLAGWYGEGRGGQAAGTIIVCHGWAADTRDLRRIAEALRRRGFDVLAFDLHGWGESSGGAVTFGAREEADILGAVRFVKTVRPAEPERPIGLLGFSMGAAAAILAAAESRDVTAVVADGSYARLDVQVARFFRRFAGPLWALAEAPGRWLGERLIGIPIDTIAPVEAIGRIAPRPVLIIHGTRDRVIDVQDARRLYRAAGAPKSLWLVEGAGHGQTRRLALVGLWDARVAGFFQSSFERRPARKPDRVMPF